MEEYPDFNQDEMLYLVARLSRYYKPEVVEYLKALVNLELSVFENEDFNQEFLKLDSYAKIFYYNILNRAIKKIKEINNVVFNKDRLKVGSAFGELNVFYFGGNDNDTFSLLSTNFKFNNYTGEKPVIRVTQINKIKPGSTTNSLKTLSNLRRDLTNEATIQLLNDWNIELTENDKRLFTTDYVKTLSWIEIRKTMQ